jgi:ADP-ribose pyrophosphatase
MLLYSRMSTKPELWTCERRETLLEAPIFTLERKHYILPDGTRPHPFYGFLARDWCNLIPVTRTGRIVLVDQFRSGTDARHLEIPGGVVDPSDTDIGSAALRELKEETGYALATGGRITKLIATHPNPAIQNNLCHLFIAGPVERCFEPRLEVGEDLHTLEVGIDELPRLLHEGKISHALMLNAFFYVSLLNPMTEHALKTELLGFSRPAPA